MMPTKNAKEPITCFEYDTISYSEIGDDLDKLEELNRRFNGGNLLVFGRRQLRTTSYVGVVRAGSTTIQILPKIDRNDDFKGATKNLLQLLSYANDLKIHEQQVASIVSQRADWLELLTGIYASHLHRLVQQGIRRDYVEVEETLPMLRGKWMLQRQLTRRPHIKHLFDVSYDEFTIDNSLNRVFSYVTERLLLTSRLQQNRQKLKDIQSWLSDVRLVGNITSSDLNRIVFNRLNEHYLPVFNLARMFIEGYTPLFATGNQNTFAFVFDMNKLFENFIAGFTLRNRSSIIPFDWKMHTQGLERQTYLMRWSDGIQNQDVFLLKPDLVFINSHREVKLIVDTKYKLLDDEDTKHNVSSNDMYQMLAYATRYKCKNIVLLYPEHTEISTKKEVFTVYEQGAKVTVATVNISEPLNQPEMCIKFAERLQHLFHRSAVLESEN